VESEVEQVHLQIKEHAHRITLLAEQVVDRGVKIRLIGLALGLLEVMDMTAPRDANHGMSLFSASASRAGPQR